MSDRFEVESATVRVVVRPCDPPFAIDWIVVTETAYLVCELEAAGQTGLGYAFFFDAGHAPAGAALMTALIGQAFSGADSVGPADVAARLATALALTGYPGIGVSCAAAIEMACWDLFTKRAGLSWAQHCGTATARRYPGYVTCGSVTATPDQVARDVDRAAEQGFRMVKIKVGQDDAGDDARLAAARRAGGGRMSILVDANQTWDYKTARTLLHRWHSGYDLFWAEEPLPADDLENLRRLKDDVDVRIATGESYYGVSSLLAIIEARAADVLTVNPQKVGGITAFRRLTAAANLANTAVTCHTFGEVAANLLLDARTVPAVEVVPWMLGVFDNAPEVVDGFVQVTHQPGLGLRLSDAAEKWTTFTAPVPIGPGPS